MVDNKIIKVPMSNGYTLVVEVYPAEEECHKDEITIYLIDKADVMVQDIALIREHLEDPDVIEAFIWGDCWSEDYTIREEVEIYNPNKD